MSLLRLMLTTLVLLAQAWPLQAEGTASGEAACETGCCSWLAEAEVMACACTDDSPPAAPANVPPAGSRELVPPVTWVAASEMPLPKLPAANSEAAAWQQHANEARETRGVRLAVLFCSFLN